MDSALSLGDPAGLGLRVDECCPRGILLVFGVSGGVLENIYCVTND